MYPKFRHVAAARFARHAASALLAVALVGAAACGKDKKITGSSVAGTYTLRTVNGHTVPFTFTIGTVNDPNGWGKVTVNGGSVTLQSNGSYATTLDVVFNDCVGTQCGPDQNAGDTDSGTFTISGNTMTITSSGGSVDTATISNGTITATFDDADLGHVILVFRK